MAERNRCFRKQTLTSLLGFVIFFLISQVEKGADCAQSFEVQPGDTTVLIGESFTLYCTVAGKTGVTYWDKDNVTFAVPGDGQRPASDRWAVFGDQDSGEYNLQVLQAQQSDEGTYMCKSTGSEPGENEITSSPADVTVMPPPPTGSNPICLTSTTGNLMEGDPVDFTCAFAPTDGDNSSTTVSWERSGPRVNQLIALPLSSIVGREGYVVRKMTVTITIADHLASYTCSVFDGSGRETTTCSTGSLLVQHTPIVEMSPVSIDTTEGNNATFTCSLISAYPTDISYEWYYLGRVVQPGEDKLILGNATDGRTIRILDLSGNDDGAQVTCIVSNNLGSGTASSVITLSERPFDLERDILIWLIPLGAIALVLMLVSLLAIYLLDCRLLAKCCDKRKYNNVQGPTSRTWSMANLAMTLRSTGPVNVEDEYFIARSIRSKENAGIRPDKNVEDRKKPLPEDHVNPNFILEKEGAKPGTTEREKQRKTRSERDRLRKRGMENPYVEEDNFDVGKDKSLAKIEKQDSQNVDSGLEGMSSSKESNSSPTLRRLNDNVKKKKALYAEVERINLGLDRR